MNVEQIVLNRLKNLPREKQKEVLDFVDFLHQRSGPKRLTGSLKGFWGNLGIDVADEDINEVRREMWGEFPRGDIQ